MFSHRSLKTFLIHYEMALCNIRTFKTFIQMAALLKPWPSFSQIPVQTVLMTLCFKDGSILSQVINSWNRPIF